MPLYVYECEQCASRKELIRSFACADDDEICERCFQDSGDSLEFPPKEKVRSKMKRVMFPGNHNFHLKGRGWAKDGYK